MNFKVWVKDRLATKSVYRRIGNKETVYITDNIDLSKVTAITIGEDYKGVVGLRLAFPPGHLKTNKIENSKLIKTETPAHLDFYCRYGAVDDQKKFYFDRMFDDLYALVALLKIEKGLMTPAIMKQESEDWNHVRMNKRQALMIHFE